jgi:hypothetical protein
MCITVDKLSFTVLFDIILFRVFFILTFKFTMDVN